MPSYAEERGIQNPVPKEMNEENRRIRDLEKENRRLRKELLDEQEKAEILKNPYTSLCKHKNEI